MKATTKTGKQLQSIYNEFEKSRVESFDCDFHTALDFIVKKYALNSDDKETIIAWYDDQEG